MGMSKMHRNIWAAIHAKCNTTCRDTYSPQNTHRPDSLGRMGGARHTDTSQRIETLRNHKPWETGREGEQHQNATRTNKNIQHQQLASQDNVKKKARKRLEQRTPRGELGLIKRMRDTSQTKRKWKRNIAQCEQTSPETDNLSNRSGAMRKNENLRMSRQTARGHICNQEYSNAISPLTHMEMRNAYMAWRPGTCEILHQNLIPPEINAAINKWKLIQAHNQPDQTMRRKQLIVRPYIELLQTPQERRA